MSINQIGYVFNRDEIACISGAMGAYRVFDCGIELNRSTREDIGTGRISLESKGYITVDSNGRYTLKPELAAMFRVFVQPERIVSVRKRVDCSDMEIFYLVREGSYIRIEKDYTNDDIFIFSYFDSMAAFKMDLMQNAFEEDGPELEVKGSRFILSIDEYKIMKELLHEGEIEGYMRLALDAGLNEETAEEAMSVFNDESDFVTIGFFYDYKRFPTRFYCLVFYLDSGPEATRCWEMDSRLEYGNNIRFSPVSYQDISNEIDENLKLILEK